MSDTFEKEVQSSPVRSLSGNRPVARPVVVPPAAPAVVPVAAPVVAVTDAPVNDSAPVEQAQVSQQPLRTDGPTLEEYIRAGYSATNYPPQGYAARSSRRYKFAKLWGTAEELTFKDGTTFKFRLIPRVTGGYSPTSSVETTDERLAKNLRELAKVNPSVREAPVK